MVGIILTVTLFVSLPLAVASAAEARTTCGQTAPSCDMVSADEAASEGARVPNWPDQPRYATPAMIDCRVPLVAPSLQALVGECVGTTRDTSYRASRDPESERSSGSLQPARRERTRASALSACAGIPSEGGNTTNSVSPSQPLALFALPDLPRLSASRFVSDAAVLLPSRLLRPLERPPRA